MKVGQRHNHPGYVANIHLFHLQPVFNFWEPLHYITHGSGFQTWEVTPQFAIRSWAYILLHFPFTVFGKMLSTSKVRRPFLFHSGSFNSQTATFFLRCAFDVRSYLFSM